MATRNWPRNQGHVLVIPNEHFENVYDLPASLLAEVHLLGKQIALAMKAEYKCDGVLFEQSNEPAGEQKIWHYHLHVIVRYDHDDFQNAKKESYPSVLRMEYARRLRSCMESQEYINHE